jgi:serine/threonine protein kinase
MVTRQKPKQGWFVDAFEGNIKDSYMFMEKLASGGFGIVYLAEHKASGMMIGIE